MPLPLPGNIEINRTINQLLHAVGYPVSLRGVCYGLTLMWIEARLKGALEEQRFFERLNYLNQHTERVRQALLQFQAKTLSRENALYNKITMDIIPFFDGIALYQEPIISKKITRHKIVAQHPYPQEMATPIIASLLDSSRSTELSLLKQIVRPYHNRITLRQYAHSLTKLMQNLAKNNNQLTDNTPLGITINSYGHVVGLRYLPSTQQWLLFDSNQAPYRIVKPDALPHELLRALRTSRHRISLASLTHRSPPPVVSLYTTKKFRHNPENESLIKKIMTFKPDPPPKKSITASLTSSLKKLGKRLKSLWLLRHSIHTPRLAASLKTLRTLNKPGALSPDTVEPVVKKLYDLLNSHANKGSKIKIQEWLYKKNAGLRPIDEIIIINDLKLLSLLRHSYALTVSTYRSVYQENILHLLAGYYQGNTFTEALGSLQLSPDQLATLASEPTNTGNTPLFLAIETGNQQAIEYLTATLSTTINWSHRNQFGETLLLAASARQNIKAINSLLTAGCLIQGKDQRGENLIHYVLRWQDAQQREAFINRLANEYPHQLCSLLGAKNAIGQNPLQSILLSEEQYASAALLIEKGSPIGDIFHYTATWSPQAQEKLMAKVMEHRTDKEIVHWLEAKNIDGQTPTDIAKRHQMASPQGLYNQLKAKKSLSSPHSADTLFSPISPMTQHKQPLKHHNPQPPLSLHKPQK